MVTIELRNNRSKLTGPLRETHPLYKSMKVRNPNAFYLRQYMPRGWDGHIDYIHESGNFSTGLLPIILAKAKELEIKIKLIENRDLSTFNNFKVPKKIGDKEPRPYQREAITAIVNNVVHKSTYFPRGIIKAATNAGKTMISAGLYETYQFPFMFIINSKELFDEMMEELPSLLPGKVGYINAKGIVWNDFMVCMSTTLKNRVPKIRHELSRYKGLIVDECDLSDNKTYKEILKALEDTTVRVGLSGSVFVSPLKKDLPKNMNMKSFFGDQVYEITNRELMDLGHSSEVRVKFIRGNVDPMVGLSYVEQYEKGVIKNRKRNLKSVKRAKYHVSKGRLPMLIIAQRHEHIMRLYKLYLKHFPDLSVNWVHHKRKDRTKIVKQFKDGKLDILIGSMILKRGKNFKQMKYMQNAGGGKSVENCLQLLGRATRKHESKKFTYYEDFWDEGVYLKRHSRKRAITLKNEKIRVTNKYY